MDRRFVIRTTLTIIFNYRSRFDQYGIAKNYISSRYSLLVSAERLRNFFAIGCSYGLKTHRLVAPSGEKVLNKSQ